MNHAELRRAAAGVWSGPRVVGVRPAGATWRGSLLLPYGCKKYAPRPEKCKYESRICEFPSYPTEPLRDKSAMRSSCSDLIRKLPLLLRLVLRAASRCHPYVVEAFPPHVGLAIVAPHPHVVQLLLRYGAKTGFLGRFHLPDHRRGGDVGLPHPQRRGLAGSRWAFVLSHL